MAAQVAAGVGFIGAGAIIRHNIAVLGVTTAAAVWLAAAVGVMAAAGGHIAAAISTVLTLAVLIGLRPLKPWASRIGRCRSMLQVEYEVGHGTLGPLLHALEEVNGRLDRIILDDDSHRTRTVTMHVAIRATHRQLLVDAVKDRPEVRRLSMAASDRD